MEVKGVAVQSIPIFIEKTFGKEGKEKWLESLVEKVNKEYSHIILPSAWYDLNEFLVEPTIVASKLFFNGDISKCALEFGRFSAEHALKGIYKIFVKLGSPKFIIEKAGSIMPSYYKPSAMEVVEVTSGSARLRITEFKDMHTVAELRIKGWIEKAIELSGAKNISVKISKSLTLKDPYTELWITWE